MAKQKPNLKAKLDVIFSRYIRLRDMLPNQTFICISCGQVKHITQADCGHFIPRQYMALRFDELNCNAQCRKCNRFDNGNPFGYSKGIEVRYGAKVLNMLLVRKNAFMKFTDFEYQQLIKHYTEKVAELEKIKGKLPEYH